jgi:hypothetical protein
MARGTSLHGCEEKKVNKTHTPLRPDGDIIDGDIIVNENMVLGLDECFTVMSGCVSQFKSHGVDIDSSEGETFNECALEVFQLFQPLVFLNSRPSLSLCSDFLFLASHLNV